MEVVHIYHNICVCPSLAWYPVFNQERKYRWTSDCLCGLFNNQLRISEIS